MVGGGGGVPVRSDPGGEARKGGPAHLPSDLRALVRVSAALASRRPELLRATLEEAETRADPTEVEEVLLQSYLFLGFPAALAGLGVWRSLRGGDPPEPRREDPSLWEGRGAQVCARVYGDQYPGLRENIGRLHPEMDRWMVLEGYGKVLGRPGLDLGRRELCIVAILAVLDAPVQLYSHLRGALNVGVPAGRVEEALEEALALTPSRGAARRARETWARLGARRARE